MERSVLVTGGAGYIGSHCCKALHAAGYTPVSFDNLSTGHREFVKWGPLEIGDIRDAGRVADVLSRYEVSAVMHFAAASIVSESTVDPGTYYETNVSGTLSLLQAMRLRGIDKFVFSSTGAVYGNASHQRLSEDAVCAPINPYGKSKRVVETILADYAGAYDLRSFSLRYFNAAGADPSADIGENRRTETHLIPRAILAALGKIDDFAIFGEDYETPDGTAVRDYIHVTDLAHAHVAALEKLLVGARGDCCNLGTGDGYSVLQILKAICKQTKTTFEWQVRPKRAGDPAILVADPSKAKSILNFEPKLSDIDTIVSTAWAWHQKITARASHSPSGSPVAIEK
jgi:UDP-glucose-4-epimerase GalE